MPIVTSSEMFRRAYKEGYAVGAFNVINMEFVQGVTEAAIEIRAPLILQVPSNTRLEDYPFLFKLIETAAGESGLPICAHLDHGNSFELCKRCIDQGFTSVMIDGSRKSLKDNIALTKQVVEYAHDHGVVVEGELGSLAGVEGDVNVSEEDAKYTRPEEVEEFVFRTGVDSLAIAIGTSHGAYKFKPGQDPQLRFDILECIGKRLPFFPIVLHGASSVMPEYIEMINANGGCMEDVVGIPDDMLRQAARMAVCKINIFSDLKLAMTGIIRKYFKEHPDNFDSREYMMSVREGIKAMVIHKLDHILGCSGKAL